MADAHDLPPDAVLIVGAGLAGLFLALKLDRPCVVLSPSPLGQSAASAWAQGGMAVALAANDSAALHAHDTIEAGAGLVDPVVATLIATEGPNRVRDLLALGVPFDRSPDGALRASLEAAHSRPRVVRVGGDLAGRAIMQALTAAVRATPRIRVMEGLQARALLQDSSGRAIGVLTRDAAGKAIALAAGAVVLATGGVGALFRVTTNPASAEGHGLALAARAGALIADPEFVQFHPTALDVGRDPAPLATEALRGEGAQLRNTDGAAFMSRYDPRGALAPRDVVARAIHAERAAGRGALLDLTSLQDHLEADFPTVFAACVESGFDPRRVSVPVAPAAHYHMGGVVTDLWGQTTIEGLSAAGECASTGAHGANRLASNSLLEAVVFAARIAERLNGAAISAFTAITAATPPSELPDDRRMALRNVMAQHVGVVRTAEDRAAAVSFLRGEITRSGLSNELLAALLIAEGAARRRESRGAHYAPDHPHLDIPPKRTFLTLADLDLP